MNREVLHIGVSENGGARVLRLTGELDSYTSDRLTSISKTWIQGAKKVVVSLDGLEYVDSTGLTALVGMWVEVTGRGAQMILSCRNPRIHRVLEITGLLNLFDVDSAVAEPKIIADRGFGRTAAGPADGPVPQAKSPPVRILSEGD